MFAPTKAETMARRGQRSAPPKMLLPGLFAGGILSSILYTIMNIFIPMLYKGYNAGSQTVSELSAIGAPTRPLWVALGIVYGLLATAFGWGIWKSSVQNRSVRAVGGLMIAYGIISVFWPPMHTRVTLAAGGKTITDTMHLVFTGVAVLIMLLAISFGAAAFGKRFRYYSIATIVLLLTFGALTATYAPRVELNLPTPWAGVWERVNIGVFLAWVVVLATILWRAEKQ